MNEEEKNRIEETFERNIEILARRMIGTATEITILEQPLILQFKDLIHRLEKQQSEIEKKDTLINTMQAEFERLENLEDDTDVLKLELKKKGMIIDLMASFISCYELDKDIVKTYCDGKLDNCKHPEEHTCKQCIKQYFEKKIKKDK